MEVVHMWLVLRAQTSNKKICPNIYGFYSCYKAVCCQPCTFNLRIKRFVLILQCKLASLVGPHKPSSLCMQMMFFLWKDKNVFSTPLEPYWPCGYFDQKIVEKYSGTSKPRHKITRELLLFPTRIPWEILWNWSKTPHREKGIDEN